MLTPVELESRFEVYAEQYILAIEVEARLAFRIARTQIYPVVMQSLERLSRSLRDQEAIGIQSDRGLATKIADLNSQLVQRCGALRRPCQSPPRHPWPPAPLRRHPDAADRQPPGGGGWPGDPGG